MKRYAILIGSSHFDEKSGLKPLRCPENDVDGMHEIVAAQELGAFTETFPLKNVAHHKVIDQIEETLEVATGDDQILIYYSGHGKTDLPGDLYLTTSNTKEGKLFSSSVPVSSLRTLIRNSRCKKIMMILDCCFAGAAGQAFTKSSKDEKLKELARGNGIYLLTATTAEDTAMESDDYSLLTKYIIKGIKSGAAARQGATHISIEDVYSYANLQVTAEGHQKPMRWALNVRGEELIIAAVRVQTDRLRYLEDQILGAWARRLTRKIRIEAQQIISECYAQPGLHESKLQLLENLFSGKLESGEFQDEWDTLGAVELKPKIQPVAVITNKEETEKQVSRITLPKFDFTTVKLDQRGKEIERQQLQANQFIEELAPDINLEMVSIPGGTFTMGSPKTEKGHSDGETQHKVTVSPFYLGKFTITQEQWRVIAADTALKVNRDLAPDPARFKGQDRPVENVSWEDAEEYCARLAKKMGRAYRLPTEAEWEYGCRAGTTTPFAFGETITPDIVNYDGGYPYAEAPKGKYRKETTPVGSLDVANSFGLFDMHGNVWEWCQDWYGAYEGKDLIDPTRVKSGSRRVLRGGSFNFYARFCRAAFRYYSSPDFRIDDLGFRCVISARTL